VDLERLILFLVLTIAPLFNLLYRAWQQKQERSEGDGAAAPPPVDGQPTAPPPMPARPARPSARPRGSVRPLVRAAASQGGAPAAAPRTARRPRTRMNTPLRRAVVLRELLGPCRALEPYEPR
jgi:hypothetical protein